MDEWVDYIRFTLAVSSFLLACFLVYDLIANGFDWSVLLGILVCFLAAHYLKPDFKKSNKPDVYDWIDIIDFIIDIPFRFLVYTIRAVGKAKNVDSIDI